MTSFSFPPFPLPFTYIWVGFGVEREGVLFGLPEGERDVFVVVGVALE